VFRSVTVKQPDPLEMASNCFWKERAGCQKGTCPRSSPVAVPLSSFLRVRQDVGDLVDDLVGAPILREGGRGSLQPVSCGVQYSVRSLQRLFTRSKASLRR
jgi:hypothetical protein